MLAGLITRRPMVQIHSPLIKIKKMEKDLAWLAGLMDGEGCYTINISKHHKYALKIEPRISLSMKMAPWVNKVKRLFEEYSITYFANGRQYNQMEFVIRNQSAKNLINLLLPFSEIKKPVMSKILELPSRAHRNRFVPMQQDYIDKIVEVVDFVRKFNYSKNRKHKWDGALIRMYYKNPKLDYKSIKPHGVY